MVSRDDVIAEARAIAELQGASGPALDVGLAALAPHLARYAELVVCERGIEVISGGVGRATAVDLAKIATEGLVVRRAADAFLACDAAFPDRMLGLKLCFGERASRPTLYVRTLAPRAEVMAFLATLPEIAPALGALEEALAENTTLYGLGFTTIDGALALKTYTVSNVELRPGFVSWRTANGALVREAKRYLPDLAWSELPHGSPFARVRERVPADRVGHLGVVESSSGTPEMKLYLERIGAIPSDFSAR